VRQQRVLAAAICFCMSGDARKRALRFIRSAKSGALNLHDEFNFALLRRLVILSWPKLIIEMQGPLLPVQPHLGKSFRPKRKLPSFPRNRQSEILPANYNR
jgi:hypothetical protein